MIDRLNDLTTRKTTAYEQHANELNEETSGDEDVADGVSADAPPLLKVLKSLGKEDAEMHLIKLRENEIMEEFPDSDRERGLLRKSMIRSLLNSLPQDDAEFRANISLKLRETTDPRQMKYLPAVLEILSRVKL